MCRKPPNEIEAAGVKNNMKKYTRAAAALTAGICCAMAVAGPSVKWLRQTYDFGAFDESVGLNHARFAFVNDGDEPIVIVSARANCGCTTPKYSPEPVAPGDTAYLDVAYDASGRPGRFMKKIYVNTSAKPERDVLTVCGTAIGKDATVSQRYPAQVGKMRVARNAALLGTAKKGHLKSVFVQGYNQSPESIVPSVKDVPGWLTVSVAPDTVPPGEQFSLTFFVTPDKSPLYDMVTDTVTLTDGDGARLRMPVIVTFEEDFSRLSDKELAESPAATLSAGRVSLTETGKGTVTLTNTGRKPLQIRRIYTADPRVSVDCGARTLGKGKTAAINVALTDEGREAPLVNAPVIIVTNDPLNPRQILRAIAAKE